MAKKKKEKKIIAKNVELDIQQMIRELEADLKSEIDKEFELSSRLRDLELELTETRIKLTNIKKEREKYKKGYSTIEQSNIWRFTSPARAIGGGIKKIAKRKSTSSKLDIKKTKEIKKENKENKEKTTNKVNSNKKEVTDTRMSKVTDSTDKKSKKKWMKNAQRKIDFLKKNLHNIGFTEEALHDLKQLTRDKEKPYIRRLAARELARYYVSLNTKEGAKKGLELLPISTQGDTDEKRIRMATFLEAECHAILGNDEKAKNIILNYLQNEEHPDLFLGMVNLEPSITGKIKWINKVFKYYNLAEVSIEGAKPGYEYDGLKGITVNQTIIEKKEQPKVTVIVPAYNAEDTIKTTLDSILAQTWNNLEVIVVDDCSTDNTLKVAEEYQKLDFRIKVLKTESNGGPYIARNLATKMATGEFITCNDSDDWSHPQKIEKQVLHLINNPEIIGNTSQQARATTDLMFKRWVNYGVLIHTNTSSFMYRRKIVMEKVGYLDSVRFGADNEFIKRIKKVFGEETVKNLSTGPLSFQRQSKGSLVDNQFFGIRAHYMGARKEYLESYSNYHENSTNLHIEFPLRERPFAVPEPMLPKREVNSLGRREFDILYATDFRLKGSSITSLVNEIEILRSFNLRIGLIQIASYKIDPKREVDSKIRKLIDGKNIQMIVFGEKVDSDILILRSPQVLDLKQRFIPEVKAKRTHVIINQTPLKDYESSNEVNYNLIRCKNNLKDYFGDNSEWHPLKEDIRNKLLDYHKQELQGIYLSEVDWSVDVLKSLIINNKFELSKETLDFNPDKLVNFDNNALEKEVDMYIKGDSKELALVVQQLVQSADKALTRGPYSVVDKTTLPPSNNPNDYWHPHPYWWPNPDTPDGLPYVKRDGERAPGTRMYEPDSDKYDRTRLQRVFDDSLILSLAWKFTGEKKYAEHGVRILERFFVNPETKMNPHLHFSQVRVGRNKNRGSSSGLIEMKDLYYYLDSVRLLKKSGALREDTLNVFKDWLAEYLNWLLTSPQGIEESKRANNHGTYYDLQVASIAAFLNKKTLLLETLLRSQNRIGEQFDEDGSQPEELRRTITKHYCCFNLQGWINLSKIASRLGIDFWSFKPKKGGSLEKGANWFLSFYGSEWPYEQIDDYDEERFWPIWFGIPEGKVNISKFINTDKTKYEFKAIFNPHDGVRPYWNLGNSKIENNYSYVKVTPEDKIQVQKAEKKVQLLKQKLQNLGFTQRAYKDLFDQYENSECDIERRLAARELALWHANQNNQLDYRKCLEIIPTSVYGEKDVKRLRQAAIIEAECNEKLGNIDEAKAILSNAIEKWPHADLILAYANLHPTVEERVYWINKVLDMYNISNISITNTAELPYDSLRVEKRDVNEAAKDPSPKVTVIVPVYNSERTIKTAIDSILAQTWRNLEVLVVDDCSTDSTLKIIEEYVRRDDRLKLIKTKENGGPYIARNYALNEATGEFITCNDADDWSHPEKIETQVKHLIDNPNIIANTSQQARATNDMKIYRRGNYGYLIFENMSSLMFRRELVMEGIGYWDSVRFGADNEFIRRIKKVFGIDKVVYLPSGPLSFQRQSDGSLTSNDAFGYHGYFYGARKEYLESHNYYHNTADNLWYNFPQEVRPFAVPRPLLPNYGKTSLDGKFDIIIVSDFRFEKLNDAIIKEIRHYMDNTYKVGLIQMADYNVSPRKKIDSRIRSLLNEDEVQLLVYGERVICDTLVIRDSSLLKESQKYIPDVKANKIEIIINDAPDSQYEFKVWNKQLNEYFHKEAIWYPLNKNVRSIFEKSYGKKGRNNLTISKIDWEEKLFKSYVY